jgi:hypothetical protein
VTIVPQLDRNPRLLVLCQAPVGKIGLAAAAAVLLALSGRPDWAYVAIAIAAIGLFPERRRLLLAGTAVCWLVLYGVAPKWDFLREIAAGSGVTSPRGPAIVVGGVLAAMFASAAGLFVCARKWRNSFLARRPVTALLGVQFGMLLLGARLPVNGPGRLALWSAIALASVYRWCFAYALTDATAKSGDGLLRQFGTMFPFWQGVLRSPTPYAKGAAYLRKVEAGTPKEFSATQLKGLKLLLWAFVLQCAMAAFGKLAHGALGVPTLQTAIGDAAAGRFATLWMAWATVFTHFVDIMLRMSVYGHVIIGCCRLAGFNALRNTYRPLESVTLIEFWNRYYYYFKELLVDFFFFPTYLRYFKKWPRLRTFAATCAAAGIGNMLYHFDVENVARVGLLRQTAAFQVYAFYAAVLAIGIGVSQARMKRAGAREPMSLPRHLRATAGVIAFFCLLEIFDFTGVESYGLRTHVAFLLGLFGVR